MMTIKEFMDVCERRALDIDISTDYTDDYEICYCYGMELTEDGKKEFADVLEMDIELNLPSRTAIVKINHLPDEEIHDADEKVRRFFSCAAGFCRADDYDKWFQYGNER